MKQQKDIEEEAGVNSFWIRISFLGICIFVLLYIVAAFLYPGGSQADKVAKTFSWFNNYWCDLLSEQAKNGEPNTARPVAIVSWLILCFSLSVFWYFLPHLFSIKVARKKIIQVCGIASMLISVFLFTQLHDVVIHVAGALGFIAFAATFTGFYKNSMYGLFYTGLFCVALMGLNYCLMLGGSFIFYLPVVQKVTFVIVLLWILIIIRKLYFLKAKNPV